MISLRVILIAFLLACTVAFAQTAPVDDTPVAAEPEARPADPLLAAGVTIGTDAEGRPVVTDGTFHCSMTLPGPYWEFETRDTLAEMARKDAGGCSPAPRVPEGLIAQCLNKDALSIARLEALPERFLVRDKRDLEDYVNRHLNLLRTQVKAPLSIPEEPEFDLDGPIVRHRTVFVVGEGNQRTKVVVILYLVRAADEDVRVYRLICGGLEEDFDRETVDFEFMADSFRFTGTLAPEFFAAEAADEKLPRNLQAPPTASPCGGSSGMGMTMAILGVMLIYGFMRKKLRGQSTRRTGPRL